MDKIIVQVVVLLQVSKVWTYWTNPNHIVEWNTASADWMTSKSENDLRIGGHFMSRMEAKDGSISFDFKGTYTQVIENELIVYKLEDGRVVKIEFISDDSITKVVVSFDPEHENSVATQRGGWQAILDNFKKYAELRG